MVSGRRSAVHHRICPQITQIDADNENEKKTRSGREIRMEVVSSLIGDHRAQLFELSERDRYKGWPSGQLRTLSKAAIRTNGAHTVESSASICVICGPYLPSAGPIRIRENSHGRAKAKAGFYAR